MEGHPIGWPVFREKDTVVSKAAESPGQAIVFGHVATGDPDTNYFMEWCEKSRISWISRENSKRGKGDREYRKPPYGGFAEKVPEEHDGKWREGEKG